MVSECKTTPEGDGYSHQDRRRDRNAETKYLKLENALQVEVQATEKKAVTEL